MGVTAPLLLDVADAFAEAGLRDAGYVYINTDDGWLDFNRSGTAAALHPLHEQLVAGAHVRPAR